MKKKYGKRVVSLLAIRNTYQPILEQLSVHFQIAKRTVEGGFLAYGVKHDRYFCSRAFAVFGFEIPSDMFD